MAIVTSGLSKVFGLGLQAIAIPLVYHALGQHRYELYLLLSAALATIAITQMGAGPGLTQGIARARAAGEREREASLISAAFRLTGVAALIGGCGVLIAVHWISLNTLLGSAFVGDRNEIFLVTNTCVLVVVAQMIFGVVDSALAGYQEQVFTNIGAVISNILSIGTLIFICEFAPSIRNVILALYGLPTLSRVANLIILCFRRPYLLGRALSPCRGCYGALIHVGLAFWAIQVGGILEQNGGTYLLARMSSTEETNLFALVYKGLSLAGAIVAILTQPLWPAFTDAVMHGDIAWIRRSYKKIRRLLTIYSCSLAAAFAVAGQWIFRNVMHIEVVNDHMLFIILAVYLIANIWTHLFYVTMMGMAGIWRIAIVGLCENLLMMILGFLLVPRLGAAGMALAYLVASIALPVWLLPRMMKARIDGIARDAQAV